VAIAGANAYDKTLVELTLKNFGVRRPRPKPGGRKQHCCGDEGYDYADTRELLRRWDQTLHVKSRGEEAKQLRSNPRKRARRWVVERSHSWINRFRRRLIRWEKKADNYQAMLHLAFAIITWNAAGVLG
jgi:IS5 family transposase